MTELSNPNKLTDDTNRKEHDRTECLGTAWVQHHKYDQSNNDGKIDTGTISTAFLGYAPYNNPIVSFTIITPDVSIVNNNDYISMVTKRTTQDISNAYFEMLG